MTSKTLNEGSCDCKCWSSANRFSGQRRKTGHLYLFIVPVNHIARFELAYLNIQKLCWVPASMMSHFWIKEGQLGPCVRENSVFKVKVVSVYKPKIAR